MSDEREPVVISIPASLADRLSRESDGRFRGTDIGHVGLLVRAVRCAEDAETDSTRERTRVDRYTGERIRTFCGGSEDEAGDAVRRLRAEGLLVDRMPS